MNCSNFADKIKEFRLGIEGMRQRFKGNPQSDQIALSLDSLEECLDEMYKEQQEIQSFAENAPFGSRSLLRDSSVVGLQGMTTEVTERKGVEEALRESEQRLANIIDFLPDATFAVNQEGKVIAWNRAIEEMTGIGKDEILDRGSYAYAVPFYGEPRPILIDLVIQDQKGIESKYTNIIRKGDQLIAEALTPMLNQGKGAYLWGIASPLYDRNGSIVGAIESIRDITERKQEQEELQNSLKFLETMINTIPSPIFFKDRQGRYLGCNDTFAGQILGLPKESIIGKSVYELPETILSDLADRSYEQDQELFKESGVQVYETQAQCADGVRRDFLYSKATFNNFAGEAAGIVGVMLEITERKQAEEALRASHQILDGIINAIPVRVFWKNRDLVYLGCNAIFAHDAGFADSKDIVGKDDYQMGWRDQVELYRADDRQVIDSGSPKLLIEEPQTTPEGNTVVLLTSKIPLCSSEGEIIGVLGTYMDITDRKRAEDQLRETRNYLENLLDYANAPIIVWDPTFRITRFNHAFEHLTGYTAEEVIGQKLEILFPESSRDLSFSKIERTLAGEYWESVEVPILQKDGTIRIVLWNSANIYAADSKTFLATMAQGTDITERKRAEEVIKESERRLADIINFLPDATFVIDRDSKVIAWNRAIEIMTGIKAEEILGKGNYEYAIPFYGERKPILIDLVLKPQEEIESRYEEITRKNGTLVSEAYMPNLKGGEVYLTGSAAALYDSDGNIAGAIESIRDITERKHAEEDLRRAKEEAESATHTKSEFLATMSHEIRTPMNAVIGMTSLLLTVDLPPEQRECVEIIHSSGEALLAVINDILDFSKIEEGRGKLEHQLFDLRECVESSMDLVASTAAEKGLHLVCTVDDDVPKNLMGDVTRLRQILVNLLSNAVKFTDAGGVDVSVISQKKGDSHELCFTVRDTGIGIPPERMSRLFKSFSQVDMSTSRKYGGTGLGLAISKRLIEMMGGKIWAESEAGKGSVFHFTIVADHVLSAETAKEPAQKSEVCSQIDVSLRILLAEDNIVNQKVVLRMLKNLGITADVAANGIEVLQALERQPYDVVLMDVQMPEMDGLEAARTIRQRWDVQKRPHVIALTAYALEGDREKCIEAGMDEYVSKPVKMGDLIRILCRYQPVKEKNIDGS